MEPLMRRWEVEFVNAGNKENAALALWFENMLNSNEEATLRVFVNTEIKVDSLPGEGGSRIPALILRGPTRNIDVAIVQKERRKP
jgi:hypothetical protein